MKIKNFTAQRITLTFMAILVMPFLGFTASNNMQEKQNLEKRIDDALLKGIEFLKTECRQDGCWIGGDIKEGATALVIYTLARCKEWFGKNKLKEIDQVIEKGIKSVLNSKFISTTGDEQYAIALAIMALEAHDRKKHAGKIKELVQVLINRQDDSGGWGYRKAPSGNDASPDKKCSVRPDVSITQYVILGLFAAHHSGVKIDNKVLQNALQWMLKAQFPNGSWFCCTQGGGVHSDNTKQLENKINLNMTAAGLGTILLCEYILGKNLGDIKPEQIKAAIKKAEELLESHWKDEKQDSKNHDYQHFYYLYGIERSFTLLDKDKIGKEDWYHTGAEKLILPLQNKEGSFEHKGTLCLTRHKVLQTSFALLFLCRATEAFFTQ